MSKTKPTPLKKHKPLKLVPPTKAQRKAFNDAVDQQPARTVKWDPSERSAAPGSPEGVLTDSLKQTATKRKPIAPGLPANPKAPVVELIRPAVGKPYAPKPLKMSNAKGTHVQMDFDRAIEYAGPQMTKGTLRSGTPNMMAAIQRHGRDAYYALVAFNEHAVPAADSKRWYLVPITVSKDSTAAQVRVAVKKALAWRDLYLIGLRLDEALQEERA